MVDANKRFVRCCCESFRSIHRDAEAASHAWPARKGNAIDIRKAEI